MRLCSAPVVYPPGPLYYPAPPAPATQINCMPCCLGGTRQAPRAPPPGWSASRGATLYDRGENRYEFFPLGPNFFLNHRRRKSSQGKGKLEHKESSMLPLESGSSPNVRDDFSLCIRGTHSHSVCCLAPYCLGGSQCQVAYCGRRFHPNFICFDGNAAATAQRSRPSRALRVRV